MNLMPVFFFGHGNPMNALQSNRYTKAWGEASQNFPTPKAILCVSAHWFIPGLRVTAMEEPKTIHDFGGFPKALFDVKYPALGDPSLARRIQDLLISHQVESDHSWGLDHGTWSILCHLYPKADVPVVQLSIDECQPAQFHFDLARQLVPLREEGILIVASGNVVHNLHAYAWGEHHKQPFSWATSFESKLRECLAKEEHQALIDYESLCQDATLAVPTPDHYYPLLYALGLRKKGEKMRVVVEGFDGGSISMLSIRFG